MSGLDPNARRMLDAALPALSPSESAKARVRAHLQSLGPAGSRDPTGERPKERAPAHREATPFASGGNWRASALFLAGLAVGAAGGVAVGYRWADVHSSRPLDMSLPPHPTQGNPGLDPSTPGTQPAADESMGGAAALEPPLRAPSVADVASRVPRFERSARATGREKSHQSVAAGDEDEIAWVLRVQKALARGEPQLALGLLGEIDQRIPNGRLVEERAACRTIALCAVQTSTRSTELASFARRYPRSIHLERVERSCGAPASKPSESK